MSDGSLEARLIGDGNVSGSGLPLPDAFTAIAEYLLDYRFAKFSELNDVVAQTMRLKTERILAIWFTWEDFTRALITKMIDAGILIQGSDEFDYYYLIQEFQSGKHYVVLKQSNIGFTARDEKTRLRAHNDSGLLQALKAAKSQWPEANWRALKDVQNAIDSLEALVGSKSVVKTAGGRKRRPPTEVRPTARELARRRYGLDGNLPGPNIKGPKFAADGLKTCNKCHKSLPPEAYERNLYWQGNHNQNWFMRGACDDCYDKRQQEYHDKLSQERRDRRELERSDSDS